MNRPISIAPAMVVCQNRVLLMLRTRLGQTAVYLQAYPRHAHIGPFGEPASKVSSVGILCRHDADGELGGSGIVWAVERDGRNGVAAKSSLGSLVQPLAGTFEYVLVVARTSPFVKMSKVGEAGFWKTPRRDDIPPEVLLLAAPKRRGSQMAAFADADSADFACRPGCAFAASLNAEARNGVTTFHAPEPVQ